jgi:type IV secretory pathway TrbL component
MGDLYISVMNACEGWLVKAGDIALKLLAVTAVIGFAIGMKDLVLSGNLTMDGIVALLVRYAFIVGLLVWLLNAPQKLAMIPASIKKIGTTISGQDISYGGLIDLFSEVVNPIVEFTNGLGWTDIGLIICMTFIIFLINCLFFMISSTVLVVEIEAVFILIGGLFTASFFVIGYFRDSFLSYIKALAAVGVKMLMLCLCLGIMRNIMSTWPGMIAAQLDNAESIFTFLMPMSCALLGFYMLVKSVPQFASSIMSGGASSLDGGMIHAAAAAGYGLGMSVIKSSRSTARGIMGAGSTVTQAAQTYKYTSQAARDTGSTPGEARMAGAKEAFKTIMTGPQPGGSYGAGDRMYQDHQRAAQFADARNGGSNSLGSPPASDSGAGSHSDSAPVNSSGESGRTTSAGTYVSPSSQSLGFAPSVNAGRAAEMNRENRADAREAMGSYGSSETDSWGSYASDRKTNEGEGANER